ncbi:MAG: Lipopolysaccharide biosynthesis protein [Acidobacteriaceae bacterium]|nr:Lipopolysaccharide biosynthesis protein [Acidobacteriaceae bacterium]
MQTIIDNAYSAAAKPGGDGVSRDADTINLLDLLIVLAKRKVLIARLTVASAVVTLVTVLFLPNIYTATTKLLPPQQAQSSTAAMLGQLGSLAGLAGQGLVSKTSSVTELYAAMLQSRTITEALVLRFKLQDCYRLKLLIEARERLADDSEISVGKDGLISVSVSNRDPKLASALANGYVEELLKLSQALAVTEASQRRLFFESQLQLAKENLSNAEVDLKKTQETTGLIQLESQAKAIIESVANLRAQIATREVQLQGMRSFATNANPDIVRLQQELDALRSQLAKLERDKSSGNGDIQVGTGRVPEAGLEYMRKLRNVKYFEAIFEILAKQYEAARIDEAKNAPLIQVMDKAIEPERKSRPARLLIILLCTFIGGFIGALLAFLLELKESLRSDPAQAARLDALRDLLSFQSTRT